MLSEDLTDAQIEDGTTLGRLTAEQKAALERLVSRIERDTIDEFVNGGEDKAWLKGARIVLAEFRAALAQTVADAKAAHEELRDPDRELRNEVSGSAGELALG